MAAPMETCFKVSVRKIAMLSRLHSSLLVKRVEILSHGDDVCRKFTTSRVFHVKKRVKAKKLSRSFIQDSASVEALSQFPTPKQVLNDVITSATNSSLRQFLRYETRRVKDSSQTMLHLKWPQEFSVIGVGRRKADSEKMAAALACSHLMKLGVLGEDGKPRTGRSATLRKDIKHHLQKMSLPDKVQLPEDLKLKIRTLHTRQEESSELEDGVDISFSDEFNFDTEEDSSQISDIITGRPYREIREEVLQQRSQFLFDRWSQSRQYQTSSRLAAADLPIAVEREAILSVLQNNRVAVLCGDTGCGKTTQVPQFILDSFLEKCEGAKCNIVVTQPRRISAISVAERIAEERGERVGDTIGYQVRLKSSLPRNNGCVLFCTTGILLKKLQSNPTLQGISHVIVDEVHERDINTDFLLILLKNALISNPNLSLLLMSASINAEMFSRYFDGCPLIMVPGRMYPVQELFLPEVMERLDDAGIRHHQPYSSQEQEEKEEPETDQDLVVDVVQYLDREKPPGAILVFLPGWQDIKGVYDKLQMIWSGDNQHSVFPVHSSIPLSEQQQIFQRPREGVRKIVLATNIAETSITIDDVVYVVNTGSHKEHRYKVNLGVSCLDLFWVSKANIKQRKGRAGRCQPGECYHLFTYDTFNNMDDYEEPEILRVPLEQIVVMSKIHGPSTSAVQFLSQALQPPVKEAVERAVTELQELNILDEDENLTLLGQKVSCIGTDPRLAKALVMSSIFRCVSPILTITARLSSREPFRDSMENRPAIMKIKKEFAEEDFSDHLMSVNLFNQWREMPKEGREAVEEFHDTNFIHRPTMYFLKGLRQQFADNLEEAGMVVSAKDCLFEQDSSSDYDDEELVKGVLLGSFFPNIIKANLGKFERKKLQLKKLSFKDHNSNRVLLSRRSVNASEKSFPSRWFTYFSKMQSGEIFVHDTSMVHPLAVICFSGQPVCCKIPSSEELNTIAEYQIHLTSEDISDIIRIVVGSTTSTIASFYAQADCARVLMKLRREVNSMVQDCLELNSRADMSPSMYNRHTLILDLLVDVLNTKQPLFISPSSSRSESKDTSMQPWQQQEFEY
ncbi:ATP-dependent RNA helicase DHX36 [Holothuria leucospilota]|uniref:ATP-dependent RNA helicase DHX36 n=1 Tax=Holothuria leucospilota TaxID=206669 RepID=A0A9Q1H7H0_HOLLE|nr:ATP-dependent RNA helicase DHX36 [Holothuria leucospilota]